MSLQIRSLAAALVLVTLTTGAAQALPLSGPSHPAKEGIRVLDAVWEWVVAAVLPSEVRSKSRRSLGGSKAGGMLDVDGSMVEAGRFAPGATEEGGMMDPNGLR